MIMDLFRVHGRFCATKPWEVIVGTITVVMCMMSMTLYTGPDQICGWNSDCETKEDIRGVDIIFLLFAKIVAVVYVYAQFIKLRRLGSKYLLGLAALFTIFSSFVFSTAVMYLLGNDLTGLNEAIPFFLLLVDLSRACALARYALSSKSQNDVPENIAKGMADIGPTLTLDALVQILVLGVGTLSGVKQLETISCFGCLSVVTNYLAFMTFYPACLALILEIARGRAEGRPIWQLNKITGPLKEDEENKQNPVTQRVKVIMSAGLLLVHLRSRLFTSEEEAVNLPSTYLDMQSSFGQNIEAIPLWLFYLKRVLRFNYDSLITMALTFILIFKYVFFDEDLELVENDSEKPYEEKEEEIQNDIPPKIFEPSKSSGIFFIGDDSDSDSDKELESKETQTDFDDVDSAIRLRSVLKEGPKRTLDECVKILDSDVGPKELTDEEVRLLVKCKKIPPYKLETRLCDHERGVSIRRQLLSENLSSDSPLERLPFRNFDYKYVEGACCENVIGYMPVPVGYAGPLLLDGKEYTIPMATTEGCLVASTNRGCRAISAGRGVFSAVNKNAMTRGAVIGLHSAIRASEIRCWLDDKDNFDLIKDSFDSSSNYARLTSIMATVAGHYLYLRFAAKTGDAMGMNMISKGVERGLNKMKEVFDDIEILSLSGNYCTDKKPSAINWIEGRGKSVVCEAIIPGDTVKSVLKTTVKNLCDLNVLKNLVGSSLAGSIGGNNAHAANIVAAIFIATGQDVAQVVESSNCLTLMEPTGDNEEDLNISITMPSLEVGTIGGGTILPAQKATLKMLGVQGANRVSPGENAEQLARIVGATVLAGELSLMSALAAGHLVKSHMTHNRSTLSLANNSPCGSRRGSQVNLLRLKNNDNLPKGNLLSTSKCQESIS